MRIVNVVDVFHPDAGYENNVLSKYMIKFGHDYIILTTDLPEESGFFDNENIEKKDAEFTRETGVKIIRLKAKGRFSGRAIWQYGKFVKTIKLMKADLVFFCGNDTLIAMQYLLDPRNKKSDIIMDSHMLEMASKNRMAKVFRLFYKTFVTPIIKRNSIPIIRVQDDDYVERCLGIPIKQCPWISFGSDTMLFHPDPQKKDLFREQYNIEADAFVVIYTGKLDEAKGGKLLAEAFREHFKTNKKIALIVVGTTSGEYGKEVDEIFDNSENRIIRFPTQKYKDLANFYCAADLSVFSKQCSLSFYDAQACGLPVLSENNNINTDRCSHDNGWNFIAGSVESFRHYLEMIINMPKSNFERYSYNASQFVLGNYDYAEKAREYEDIFNNTILKMKNTGRKES